MEQVNKNSALPLNGKQKRNFSIQEKMHLNKLNQKFEDERSLLVKTIAEYWNTDHKISVLEKKEYEYKVVFGKPFKHLYEDYNKSESLTDLYQGSGTPKEPYSASMIVMVFVLLYFADLVLIKDSYLYITSGFWVGFQYIALVLLPAVMIGIYMLVFSGLEKKNTNGIKVIDNEFEFVGETDEVFVAKDEYSFFKNVKDKFILHVIKYIPLIAVGFSTGYIILGGNHGTGYKVAMIIVSVIFLAVHFATIMNFDRVYFSYQYLKYSRKLKSFTQQVDNLELKLNSIEVSIRENEQTLKNTALRLREFNPNICLPLPLSLKDEELLESIGVDTSWYGKPA